MISFDDSHHVLVSARRAYAYRAVLLVEWEIHDVDFAEILANRLELPLDEALGLND